MFTRLKNWRRIATHYDRCAEVFLTAYALGAVVILLAVRSYFARFHRILALQTIVLKLPFPSLRVFVCPQRAT
jgi:hypothetical protein